MKRHIKWENSALNMYALRGDRLIHLYVKWMNVLFYIVFPWQPLTKTFQCLFSFLTAVPEKLARVTVKSGGLFNKTRLITQLLGNGISFTTINQCVHYVWVGVLIKFSEKKIWLTIKSTLFLTPPVRFCFSLAQTLFVDYFCGSDFYYKLLLAITIAAAAATCTS